MKQGGIMSDHEQLVARIAELRKEQMKAEIASIPTRYDSANSIIRARIAIAKLVAECK